MENIRQKKIFLIDDDTGSIALMKHILEKQGVTEIETFSSAAEGLMEIPGKMPDLIILDIVMPEQDGYQTLQTIKADSRLQDIPVMMITAGTDDCDAAIEKAFDLGAADFVAKPIRKTEFLARVMSLLKLKQTRDDLRRELYSRIQAEQALTQGKQQLQAIFDTVRAGIVLVNADTHVILEVNNMAARMFNAPREQIVGKTCHRFLCPAEAGNCPITDMGQSVDNSERVLMTVEGSRIPILKTVVPLVQAGVPCLLETFVDLTELNNTKKLLQQSEEHLRATVESSLDAIITINSDCSITSWNAGAKKMFGYDAHEVLGRTTEFLVPPAMRENEIKHLRKIKETGMAPQTGKTFETKNMRKNGEVFPAEHSVFQWQAGGQTCFSAIIRDVSIRKKAEAEKEKLIENLKNALDKVQTLSGLLPICSSCHKIRDDSGYWNKIELYIKDHSQAEFTHSLCPDCARKYYPEYCDDQD